MMDGQYKGMIFDCDGTLVDSMPAHYAAWRQALSQSGLSFPEERFYQTAGMPALAIIRLLAEEAGRVVDAEAIEALRDRLFYQMEDGVRANEPVVAIVKRYAGQVPMAVASGSTRRMVTFELERIGILSCFAALVCAEDVPRPKPAPDVFRIAAERIAVAPTDCLAFEDADHGIRAAMSAGMSVMDVRSMQVVSPR